jgi:hypothetical protein
VIGKVVPSTATVAAFIMSRRVSVWSYLRDLFVKLANGHLDKDIDALIPRAYAAASQPSQ